jgi:hypothetical protein
MEKELLAKIAALAGFINNQKRIAARTIPPSNALPYRRSAQSWKAIKYDKTNSGSDFLKKGNKLIRKQPTDYVKKGRNKLVRKEIVKAHLLAPKSNIRKITTLKVSTLKYRKNQYIPKRLTINGIAFEKSSNGKSLVRSKNQKAKQIARYTLLLFNIQNTYIIVKKLKRVSKHCRERTKEFNIVYSTPNLVTFTIKVYIYMYFNCTGKCKNIETCKYVHDPNKKAICRKFLKGECHDKECILLHKIQSEKMPVCSYFLRGVCTNENCPYSHVNVNPKAAICQDFLKGYCPLGDKCKLKHVSPQRTSSSSSSNTPVVVTSSTVVPLVEDTPHTSLPIRPVFSLNKT